MAYDEYGWIVNYDLKNKVFVDKGDSCFFMGLQALNFILAKRVDLAFKLYERVRKYDFVRHPTVLDKSDDYYENQTSFDMMLIWDYIAARYSDLGFRCPPYRYRKSKYFLGKFRNPLIYVRFCGIIVLLVLKYLMRFKKTVEYFKNNYYKLHLCMLYFGVVLEKTKSKFFKNLFRSFVNEVESKFGYINVFFRFLVGDEVYVGKPVHNSCEWVYQRYFDDCLERKKDIQFHTEKVKMQVNLSCEEAVEIQEELDLSEQFWHLYVKGSKLTYIDS